MEVIACPNCGKLLNYASRHQLTLDCPKCGEVPILEDSQVISISEGQLTGPGLRNLQEPEEEFVIRSGKTFSESETKQEESVIEGVESTIKVDSPSLNPVQNAVFNSKVPAATVEEKLDFEWKAEAKQGANSFLPRSRASSQPLRYSQKNKSNPRRNIQRGALPSSSPRYAQHPTSTKAPWHYYAIFYGIPSILLLVLILFTLNKCTRPRVRMTTIGPKATWDKAEDTYRYGYVCYQEALQSKNKKDSSKYRKKLKEAKKLYLSAIRLGEKSWHEHIQVLMKSQNLSKQEAEKYAMLNQGGYQKKMQKWQREFRNILEEIGR